MRVNNISNTTNFGKVMAVAGTEEQTKTFLDRISQAKGDYLILSATDIYKNNKTSGLCEKAAKQGNEITFVITGQEDIKKASYMYPGWGSVNGISRYLSRFFDLKNLDKAVKEVIKEIHRPEPKKRKK